MAGQVVLYSDDINSRQRPDSKRPQALKSRVAGAKRSGCRHCRPCAERCGCGHCRQGFKKRYRCNGRTNALQNPGIRKDLPDSDLWSGKSCCIAMISIHANVQTRAAPKRRGVGLQRAERCGCGHCRPCAERCGSRHCRQGFKKRYRCNGRTNASQNPGIRKDLTGSNLWPVRSCCIAMIPDISNAQTRSAPKR